MQFVVLIMCLINLASANFKALDPELKNFSYPFPVEYHPAVFKDETLQMAVMDIAPKKTKGVVVLLHGKNFSGYYWEKTAKDLLQKGYRVIIPDQIGFGKSSKPKHFQYSFHLLGSLTHDILQKKKIKNYILMGHSMGGMLAARMALMYPQEVEKLLLINPIGLEDWKTKIPYKTVNELYQAELKNSPEKIREYQKNVYFDGKWKPDYEKQIEVLAGWTLHKDYPVVAWNAALTTDMVITQPVLYELKNLSTPTLLLVGTRDRTALGKNWVTPEVAKEMGRYDLLGKKVIKLIPRGKLIELEGIGHMPQVESYDSYWQNVISFIEK